MPISRPAKSFGACGSLFIIFAGLLPGALAGDAPVTQWPSFRGRGASGVAEGMDLPDKWDAETGEGLRFKVEIPGLAHSSPIIWGDRLFVTTALSSAADASFK